MKKGYTKEAKSPIPISQPHFLFSLDTDRSRKNDIATFLFINLIPMAPLSTRDALG